VLDADWGFAGAHPQPVSTTFKYRAIFKTPLFEWPNYKQFFVGGPMPLIKCQECGKDISDQASSCPHCGAPTEYGKKEAKKDRGKRRSNVQGAGCLIIILALILGLTIIGAPFAIFLGIIGLVILIVGLFIS